MSELTISVFRLFRGFRRIQRLETNDTFEAILYTKPAKNLSNMGVISIREYLLHNQYIDMFQYIVKTKFPNNAINVYS